MRGASEKLSADWPLPLRGSSRERGRIRGVLTGREGDGSLATSLCTQASAPICISPHNLTSPLSAPQLPFPFHKVNKQHVFNFNVFFYLLLHGFSSSLFEKKIWVNKNPNIRSFFPGPLKGQSNSKVDFPAPEHSSWSSHHLPPLANPSPAASLPNLITTPGMSL